MVSVVPCADYTKKNCRDAMENAISAINGLDWVRPGMRIALKLNLVSMLRPEAAATTHPALVCELVRLIKDRGAVPVIGDSPGGLYNQLYLDRVYVATGMREAEALGAELNRDFSTKHAHFPEAVKARRFEYTAWLDSCDGIINFSKLKTHGMMGMSAAVKNMFGTVPGTHKPEMHYLYPDADDFADMLVDINEYFKPRLCIVDAVTGMEGNGPTSGTPRNIGCVIASQSPYEADMICARIMGAGDSRIHTLAAAKRRGLSPDEPTIIGDITPFIQRDMELPPQHDVRFLAGTPFGHAISLFLSAKPILKKDKCTGCQKCLKVCPADAIIMKPSAAPKGHSSDSATSGGRPAPVSLRPVIDRKKCIRCFCCQEFCPQAAMISHRPLVARLLAK